MLSPVDSSSSAYATQGAQPLYSPPSLPDAAYRAPVSAGVARMLEIIEAEMRVAMTLTGVTSIDQIDHTTLVQSAK